MLRALHWLLLGLSLLGAWQTALAEQVCKYDTMQATAPASRFVDNHDGTVTDKVTGLMWKRCSEGQTWNGNDCVGNAKKFTWQEALRHSEGVSHSGYADWHLPNVKELTSILERACYPPQINLETFPSLPDDGSSSYEPTYWTSSPLILDGEAAGESPWYVNFSGYGAELPVVLTSDTPLYVRLVRTQPLQPLNDTGIDLVQGDDGEHPRQDAVLGRDKLVKDDFDGHSGFSYTKLDSFGKPLPNDAIDWACVRDNTTGLIWETKTDDGGLRDKDWRYW